MGFPNVSTFVNNQDVDGKAKYTVWRKAPNVVTAAGFWQDLSTSPGNPRPNFYATAPLTAARLARSTDVGIDHGGNVAPATKHLSRVMAFTQTAGAVPLPMTLCDYLLYYPLIDESEPSTQVMDNTVGLSRYTDGEGIRVMAVVTFAHTGGATSGIQFTYTNSNGVAGRVSQPVNLNTQNVLGTILTSGPATAGCFAPFIPLQSGDSGLRSIQDVTITGTGDVGLFALVLVKPLASFMIRGIDAPTEVELLKDRPVLPRVYDDAYLNFICCCAGSISGAQIMGDATFVWG